MATIYDMMYPLGHKIDRLLYTSTNTHFMVLDMYLNPSIISRGPHVHRQSASSARRRGIGILDYIFKYSIRPHLFIKHTRNIDTPESGCFASGSTFFWRTEELCDRVMVSNREVEGRLVIGRGWFYLQQHYWHVGRLYIASTMVVFAAVFSIQMMLSGFQCCVVDQCVAFIAPSHSIKKIKK